MERKYGCILWGGALTVLLTMGFARGELYTHSWDHPCDTPPDYGLVCPELGGDGPGPGDCWCQADWSDADNWTGIGYPNDPDSHNPQIIHSNTGHCDGGTNDGDPCSQSSDCPSGTCDDIETHLLIRLTEDIAIHPLHIDSQATAATTDALYVMFFSRTCAGGVNAGLECRSSMDCPGSTCQTASYELSPLVLYMDATNGTITLTVGSTTTLVTDTTD